MSSRIPPLLETYLALPPEASLVLLTNVLGASSNWLILRFLHSALSNSDIAAGQDAPKVLLLSFMRDLAFWKENGRRLGLDLNKLATKKRFTFVDALSELFVPKPKTVPSKVGETILSSPDLASVSREIQQAVRALKYDGNGSKVLLVVDQLDLLLAAGGVGVGSVNVDDLLMDWRENVYATVLSLSADYPVVASQQTPLEINHAAFLLSVAHQADFTMSLRLLDTGTARDVSGVVRITIGEGLQDDGGDIRRRIEEKELLYFVGGDGGVRVFERGQ